MSIKYESYVEERVRAGVLEQGTVDTLNESRVGDRMQRQGLVHHGIGLSFSGHRHRIDLYQLTGGRSITVYGQQEVVKELIAARVNKVITPMRSFVAEPMQFGRLFLAGDAAIILQVVEATLRSSDLDLASEPETTLMICETIAFGDLLVVLIVSLDSA